ncbi:MAG: trypsin-like peptidase domain-containing protein [Patescibacteria group bacterium]
MDELNKNQIVLLVLLVSFVTSIATGIVTVTLLDQAPPAVTQTINRIVERTVERVVPGETQVSTVIKEVPVIVTEEQLIVKVVNDGSKALIRLIGATPPDEGKFLGSGFLLDDGLVITDAQLFPVATSSARAKTPTYRVVLADGRQFPAERLVSGDQSSSVTIFKITSDEKVTSWPTLSLASSTPVVGQTVVALGAGEGTDLGVAVGIISGFLSSGTSTAPTIITNAASPANVGGPLLSIRGEVVGLNHGAGTVLTAATIRAAIDARPK